MADDENVSGHDAIASLSHTPVPGRHGFSFMGPPVKNGEVFDIEIVQDSKNVAVGTARGSTKADVIAHAQEIAEEFTDD
jgi:hypothetical protein